MQTAALTVLIVAGTWLMAVGLVMAFRPSYALRVLSLTASSHRVNLAEQLPRLFAGAAMVVRSEVSKVPQLFEMMGVFVVATSIILILGPLRLHSGYAIWWSRRLRPGAVRLLAPFSIVAGASLIYAAW